METLKNKYKHDDNYKALVDAIRAILLAGNFTLSEMKKATILACVMHEKTKIRHQKNAE